MLTLFTAAATSDLTVLATLKTELGITASTDDVLLADIIRRSSDIITRYCGRGTFGRATYDQTERLTRNVHAIVLDRDIKVSITSVTEDGVALTTAYYELDGTDGSMLYRLDGADGRTCWAGGSKVVIRYAAGFALLTDVPYDLESACLDLCKSAWLARTRDPALRSEKIEAIIERSWFQGRADSGAVSPEMAARLAPYVLRVFA